VGEDIEKLENLDLVDKVVLNGLVDYVITNDVNGRTIGIVDVVKRVTFSGEELVSVGGGFPLSKGMEEKLNWINRYASVRLVFGKTPIDPTKVEETIIESYFGKARAEYAHQYSDLTGYLWTDEGFQVGGHDLMKIFESHQGEYAHVEIEIYKKKDRNRLPRM
jgi:hypothetical protein